MDPTAPTIPTALLQPATPAATTTAAAAASPMSPNEAATRAHIAKTAKDYEGAFLSIMLGQMFSGVKTTTFGGGEGEDAFKSFLTDAMAKSMVRHGGIGLSKTLTSEMLKLQGLAAKPAASAAAPAATAQTAAPAKPLTLPVAPTPPAPVLDIAA